MQEFKSPTPSSHPTVQNQNRFFKPSVETARQKVPVVDSNTHKHPSKNQLLTDFDEINHLQNSRAILENHLSLTDREPSPLYIDSMLPVSADIQHTVKQSALKTIPRKDSQMKKSIGKTIKKQVSKKEIYRKLDCESEVEEDPYTKELRKMQEEKSLKQQAIKKAEREEAQLLARRLKMNKNDGKISYDYNGSQLKIRSQNRNNLISKVINGSINTQTYKNKEAFDDPNPANIEDTTTLGKKKNIMNLTKRREDVEFDGQRSLSQKVTVGGGVRYTFDGKTLTGLTTAFSAVQLKKDMHLSKRRLSKDEFQRVKSLNGSMFNPEEKVMKQTTSKELFTKFKSEGHFFQQGSPKMKREKIVVLNEKEKKKLLQIVEQQVTESRKKSKQVEKDITLGFVDVFNMNYLKSRGQSHQKGEGTSQNKFTLFPKINHHQGSSLSIPKTREKVKEPMRVILEVRKSFEEKLRT